MQKVGGVNLFLHIFARVVPNSMCEQVPSACAMRPMFGSLLNSLSSISWGSAQVSAGPNHFNFDCLRFWPKPERVVKWEFVNAQVSRGSDGPYVVCSNLMSHGHVPTSPCSMRVAFAFGVPFSWSFSSFRQHRGRSLDPSATAVLHCVGCHSMHPIVATMCKQRYRFQ